MKQHPYIKNLTQIKTILANALKEDIGSGDITAKLTIPIQQKAQAQIIAKQNGVLAGSAFIKMLFIRLDPETKIKFLVKEGNYFNKGAKIAVINGKTRILLTGERTALNILCRLSGIATLTRKFVDQIAHTSAKILDTRKTTPNLRILEKYAVKIGGGYNHRFGLYDMILIKDNHIKAAGGIINAIIQAQKGLKVIEVETKNLAEVKQALSLKVPIIMLDNMSLNQIRQAVKLVKGKAKLEVSGGVNLKTVKKIAETGVDYISVGAITHSAPIIDLSMKIVN
ncbi:MAG: carboxylating nicotinate-nucleotide diphosphorylase [Candidatus Latescibacteria bacterium]|nr:carboxylating nicotinate-nucleotide diphosphorylase [Candidatus Latescibacterota bacterium]